VMVRPIPVIEFTIPMKAIFHPINFFIS
jgi:hypothetical protein